jgi:hypothetical protein
LYTFTGTEQIRATVILRSKSKNMLRVIFVFTVIHTYNDAGVMPINDLTLEVSDTTKEDSSNADGS